MVRYAGAGGEEGDCAIGFERGVRPVGAFKEASCMEDVVFGGGGEVVELAGHALARGDDEGDGCWW